MARNSRRSPATFNVDLRLVKYVAVGQHGKLDLVLDAFNMLHRANVLAMNPLPGREGTPILRAPARELQVSIDIEF